MKGFDQLNVFLFLYRITNELRQLIKQRNKLQAQLLNGDTNAEVEKKFRKLRNKIGKHAKMLKGKRKSIQKIFCNQIFFQPNMKILFRVQQNHR